MIFSAGAWCLASQSDPSEGTKITLTSPGVSLSFSLIRRIDALVMLTKELVGESYRVHNLGKDAVEGRYTLMR